MTDEARKHELLPCPFCGGEADMEEFDGALGRVFACACTQAGCSIAFHDHGKWATRREAIAAWNTRTALQPTSQIGDAEIVAIGKDYEDGSEVEYCFSQYTFIECARAILSRATPAGGGFEEGAGNY